MFYTGPFGFAIAAIALYLLPLVIALPWLRRKVGAGAPGRVLDVALVLAVDAYATLLVARFVPLGVATWIVRCAWLVAGAALLWNWRVTLRDLFARARAVDWEYVAGIAALALIAVLLVSDLSYRYVVWDRDWHIPLVSSLRTQRAPFINAFTPVAALRYHYLGDVIPAMIQTLSGDRISSALALSLAHDIYFALIPVTVHGLLRAYGSRATGAALALLGLCAVLAGPFSFVRAMHPFTTTHSWELCGNGYLCFLTLSYRPHTVIAVYFLAVMLGTVVLRAAERPAVTPDWYRASLLIAIVAALTLLDETSLGFSGLALGMVWLAVPSALASTRARGFALLLALAATIVVITLAFQGSLSPGGPVQGVKWVSPRVIGLFGQPTYLLTGVFRHRAVFRWDDWKGVGQWLLDAFPHYSTGFLAVYVAIRLQRRDVTAIALFFVPLAVLGVFAWMRLQVNDQPEEGQRFMTAGFVLAPVVLAFLFVAAKGMPFTRAAIVVAILPPLLSTLMWHKSFFLETALYPPMTSNFGSLYDMDCRLATGPVAAGPARLRYVEQAIFYPYVSCQPSLLPGGGGNGWQLSIHGAFGHQAIETIRRSAARAPLASVICRNDSIDGVCTWARAHARCTRLGSASPMTECTLDERARALMLTDPTL